MDHVSPERRSWLVSQVRSKDKSVESGVRRVAHRLGLRFRLHRKDLPGTPDLAGEWLYLVVETKGTSLLDSLRTTEAAKIACGKAHFEALEVRDELAKYRVATSVEELLAGV